MTDLAMWGPLTWIYTWGFGGLMGFFTDLLLTPKKAPGRVWISVLLGSSGGFLSQWLLGLLLPWNILGVSWIVLPGGAFASLLYLIFCQSHSHSK